MCGNTVSHDRRFLAKHMPDLESYFHYRHVDVSSVKELISRWMNDAQTYEKKGSHRAKDDIKESINELKLYKQMLFD
jgi:oligoribonuclease